MAQALIKNSLNKKSDEILNKESGLNLDAYFERIGYNGGLAPTIETLKAIHQLHPQTIPFENLNPYLALPVNLNIASIGYKFIQQNRGGYCFEHNHLLMHVLKALGFKVKGLAGRVLWNVPEGVVPPRGHMLLLVEIESQSFIADVGFGGLTLTTPLKLQPDVEQPTSHEPFRLLKEETLYTLQAKIGDDWRSVYRFSLEEQLLPDYEVSNWFLSNNPTSIFVTNLIAARVTTNGRITLRNNEMAIHDLHGSTERRLIGSVEELKEILVEKFGLTLPSTENLNEKLQRLVNITG